MTSHDACTSGTSRILTVTTLQWLKMEDLIQTPADCEVWFMITFVNTQSITPIEISQLCQIYDHTWLDGEHVFWRSSAGRCLITIHPIAWTSRPVISIFFFCTSRNVCTVSVRVFRMTERWRWVQTVVPISGGRLLRLRMQKLIPRYDKCLSSGGEYVEKYLNSCCICSNKS